MSHESDGKGSRNAIRGYVILTILLVVFSVIAFTIPFAKTPVFWIAYLFGAFAIALQIYIFKLAGAADGDAKSRFYGFPIARLGVYYLVAQLIVSIVEMALAKFAPAWVAVVIDVILAALALIGCITTEAMRDEINRQDDRLKRDVSNMRELQSLSAAMLGQCSDPELKETLRKIADELRYSDPVSSDDTRPIEADLRSQLNDIQQALVDGDADGAKKLCAKALGSLAERNRICSISK